MRKLVHMAKVTSKLPAKRKIVTIREVAAEAGVSLQTVSRVVNEGDHVRAQTAEKVRAAIRKLGYAPNEAARMLKGQRGKMIGLIIPDLADPFFAICANAVQRTLGASGYMTTVLSTERNREFEKAEISLLATRNIAALIVVPSYESTIGELENVMLAGLPLVLMDRTLSKLECASVTAENKRGAARAVQHLLDHGYKTIACVGYDAEISSIAQRIKGYTAVMRAAGHNVDLIIRKSPQEVMTLLRERLSSAKPPRALFCLNNIVTMTALQCIQDLKLQIPEEIALVGFDDFELAGLLKIPITTVRQPAVLIGQRAAQLCLDALSTLKTGQDRPPMKIVLETDLITRNSCGC